MVVFLIGLGLSDEKDITVRGLEAIKTCSRVYLEAYTAILGVDKEKLEAFYGCNVIVSDREMVETGYEEIVRGADTENTALLVVGDPMAATTHTDFIQKARELGIKVQVIHNASIMNAIATCGLSLYRFGQTVSIPFFEKSANTHSWYDRIAQNAGIGLHTLCLLDIKVKEQSFEDQATDTKVYMPPRFMTIRQCIEQLFEIETQRKEGFCVAHSLAVGVARLGSKSETIAFGTLQELLDVDFGGPLHSLVLCGEVTPYEEEAVAVYHCNPEVYKQQKLQEQEAEGKRRDMQHQKRVLLEQQRVLQVEVERKEKQKRKEEEVRRRLAKMQENRSDVSSSESEDNHEVVEDEPLEGAAMLDNFL